MKVIAFSGKSGVGKSAICRHMQEEFHAHKLSYAQILREEAGKAGFSREILWHKPTPACVRRLLIGWGETRRFEYEDYLADKLWLKLEGCLMREDKIAVIDDLRYPNEVAQLRAFEAVFGVPVTLVRVDSDWEPPVVLHESEDALDHYRDFDVCFYNEGGNWDKIHALATRLSGEEELDAPNRTVNTAVAYEQGELQRRQGYANARAMAYDAGQNGSGPDPADSRGNPDGCDCGRASRCRVHPFYRDPRQS